MAQAKQQPQTPYGRRLMIDIIEATARTDPSKPFVFAPRSSTPVDGWKPVTFKELSQAINHVAWKIKSPGIPVTDDSFPTLAYIGPNDIRYVVVVFACIKAGFKALFISTRNSKEAQKSLLAATQCNILWHAESFTDTVRSWDLGGEINVLPVPNADAWLGSTGIEFPYSKSYKIARWDPAMVLHTSGSTGIPKPIVVSQGSLAIADAFHELPDYHGSMFMLRAWKEKANMIFSPMPLFHAAGLMILLSMSIYYDVPIALGISERPLSSDLVIDCLHYAGAQGTLLPPSIVEEVSQTEEGVKALSNLSFVAFAGGNLSSHAGERLVDKKVSLCNFISSTENFPYPLYYQNNPNAWQYFIINKDLMNSEWRTFQSDEKIYELVMHRKDPNDPGLQPVFYTFPQLAEWSTKDIYTPHPTLPDHWLYKGRADNIIVFSTGEKLNPVSMEEAIAADPHISGALVVGQGRFQPALILEPAQSCDSESSEQLIEKVWPLIERANEQTVAHGRVSRRLVIVSKPDLPFLRAPKGTILREASIKMYREDIENLYQRFKEIDQSTTVKLEMESIGSLSRSIVGLLAASFGFTNLGDESDFFDAGLDSLQVSTLTALLCSGLHSLGKQPEAGLIAPRVVYANPTAKQLAAYILSIYSPSNHDSNTSSRGEQHRQQNEEERQIGIMKELLSKYTQNIPNAPSNRLQPAYENQTILITGTTGSLGAYLLDNMCKLESVKKVVALNRGKDGGESRQPSISSSRGLSLDFSKVEFLESDLSKHDLGLGDAKYKELLETVDRMIHNAWPVNFNLSVASFEPSIRGVRHLADFAAAAKKQVPIVFLSSISTVENWRKKEPVPEGPLDDFELPNMGYGRSKFLGSRILDTAAEQAGLSAASIRVGQIAGPKGRKGVWNRQEFFPSLVASSVCLGALPDSLGPFDVIDWTPLEDVANIVLDVCGVSVPSSASQISGDFHIVNPSVVRWRDLYPTIQSYYSGRIKEVISLEEWVSRLEAATKRTDNTEMNPGIKLIDTYRGMLESDEHVYLAMEKTKQRSPTVRTLPPITPNLMTHWCEQWGF